MAYSDDAVRSKLSALNETQDSIVTVAQWIMFHRRHADRTASLWLGRLQDSPNPAKRLNLIYLANEVVQQSRARSRQEFLIAFEPLIAEATTHAYKGANQDTQGKLRRVVEVWRQRQIFDARIQEQTEKRLDEIDKQKNGKSSGEGGRRLGGTLFGGGGIAPELEGINKMQTAVAKAETGARSAVKTANTEYTKMTDAKTPVPSAPVRCAKLRGLVKDLTAAQTAVETSMNTRKSLIESLEVLLESHRAKLDEELDESSQITMKTNTIAIKAQEVEDSIMNGQITPGAHRSDGNGITESSGPEAEGFTPPPPEVESFTPPADTVDLSGDSLPVVDAPLYANPTGADLIEEQPPKLNEPPPAFQPPPPFAEQEKAAAETKDFLENLMSTTGQTRQASSDFPASVPSGGSGDPRLKRRKLNPKPNQLDEDLFGAGNMSGVDEAGISQMLGH